MKTYDINTECGPMNGIKAHDIEEAKDIYNAKHSYDFDGAENGEYPGSWFFVNESGIRVEDFTEDMPN